MQTLFPATAHANAEWSCGCGLALLMETGVSRRREVWVGRMAMFGFVAAVLGEVQLFPWLMSRVSAAHSSILFGSFSALVILL